MRGRGGRGGRGGGGGRGEEYSESECGLHYRVAMYMYPVVTMYMYIV